MTTVQRGDSVPAPNRPLRRDAQRNRDAIVAAAGEVFGEEGLQAPLEAIARRAGVGIGTLYRRFPTRVDLLDAVLTDTVQAHVDAAEQALAMDDPWEGFAFYLERTCELQAANRRGDVLSMRLERATAMEAARNRLFELSLEVIGRAQASGRLRADLTPEDLAFVLWGNARVMEATAAAGSPDAWRRHLGFLLDGFRAERASELPVPALTPRQVYRAMVTLGRRCTGEPG
jgi:AcrR family transcriptional regulator